MADIAHGVDPRVATDLRLLKLAELYEDAYERFVRDVARGSIENEAMRSRLLHLAPPEDEHAKRIRAERKRIEASLKPEDGPAVVLGALIDIVEVERAARNFYLSALKEVHDPKLVALFRQLARDEETHTSIAEGVLHDAEAVLAPAPGVAPDELAILGEEPTLLREGVVDFGTPGHPPFVSERPRGAPRRRVEPEP